MADKLDGSAIVANTIPGTKIQSGTITTTQLDPAIAAAVAVPLHPKISSLTYPGNDTAANTGGGDSIVINGSGFGTNVQVYINGTAAPSVTRNNANAVTITTAAQSAGTYLVYLINTDDGGTAILVPGIQYSGMPTWVTTSPLTGQEGAVAWSISLSATGDTPITYALQAGSSLPAGITLAANGLISGTMSSPPAEDTTYNFTVVATDPQFQDTPKAFSVSVTVVVDPQFQYTTLLLQADGTNNGNNHAFLDSSNNNFTITRNGNVTQGSFSPFSPTGWSGYFDGTGDRITFTNQSTTGNFTCECWFFATANTSGGYHILFGGSGTSGPTNTQLTARNNGTVGIALNDASVAISSSAPFSINTWNHIAWVRSGTTIAIFVNGIRAVTGTSSAALNVDRIGGQFSSYEPIGYISNARITTTAVYDPSLTTCTVPTAPFTAITGTYLLTLQDNRFIDRSASPLTLTRNGDVLIQAFSPFATTTAYLPATHGGSAYFDGTGDYLSTNATQAIPATGDFTIEAWVYPTASGPGRNIVSQGTSGSSGRLQLNVHTDNTLQFGITSTLVYSTGTVTPFAWNYVAVTRTGSSVTFYINGVNAGTATLSGSVQNTALWIGSEWSGDPYRWLGYISSVRISNNIRSISAVTSPFSSDANTVFLANFTNAQIYDAAAGAVLETVGDAKVNTAIKKYGAGSIAFDGTGDYLTQAPNQNFAFRTGDFTVEYWIYTNSSADDGIFQLSTTAGGFATSYTNGMMMAVVSGVLYYALGGSSISTSFTINNSTWYHIAMCRTSGVVKIFVNGTQVVSAANTTDVTATNLVIGGYYSTSYTLVGYIDDFRVSNGLARYRYNFTPPTRAFATKGGTQTLTADEDFEYTTLLLPGNGTNNQNNHTFLDSSNNNFTITRNGNATQGTFSPFSQTGWSMYQSDINGNYISFTTSVGTAFQFTGDFTVECWVYPVSYSGTGDTSAWVTYDGSTYFALNYDASGNYNIYLNSGAPTSSFSSGILLNQWNHIAMVRSGSTVGLYTNGLLRGTISNSSTLGHANPSVARNGGGAASNIRYMSNLRIVKGTAVYTSNFTPPTSPLTAIANTQLLTVQSNRWRDTSNNNFTPTVTGTPSVQAFSPFAPTASYAAANVGGSMYLDGAGDYLDLPANSAFNFGTGDFTIDFWLRTTTTSSDNFYRRVYMTDGPAGNGDGTNLQISMVPSSGYIELWNGTTEYIANTNVCDGAWHHIAATRSSGTMRLFVDGLIGMSTTYTSGIGTTTNSGSPRPRIGSYDGSSGDFEGYISGLRVIKGTALYTANTTVPTSPPTNVANTSLLCNFINAGILDATAKSVLETVGAAKVNTAIKQFGSGSIDLYTNNNTDYLYVKSSSAADLGSGDFTVEFWMYPQTLSTSFAQDTYSCIMDADSAAGTGTAWWVVHQYNQTIYWATDSGTYAGQTGNIITAANTWYHVAISRASGVIRTFVNGVQANTVSYSTAIGAQNRNLYIGKQPTTSRYFKGYLDDIRITKGIARYTQNFILPTTEFLTK